MGQKHAYGGTIVYCGKLGRTSAFSESRLPEHVKIHQSGCGSIVRFEETAQLSTMGNASTVARGTHNCMNAT
jgi:hypothetical protein